MTKPPEILTVHQATELLGTPAIDVPEIPDDVIETFQQEYELPTRSATILGEQTLELIIKTED